MTHEYVATGYGRVKHAYLSTDADIQKRTLSHHSYTHNHSLNYGAPAQSFDLCKTPSDGNIWARSNMNSCILKPQSQRITTYFIAVGEKTQLRAVGENMHGFVGVCLRGT